MQSRQILADALDSGLVARLNCGPKLRSQIVLLLGRSLQDYPGLFDGRMSGVLLCGIQVQTLR